MNDLPGKDGIKEYRLDSWREFHDLSIEVFLGAAAFVYRGEADESWSVRSTLDRLALRFPKMKNLTGHGQEWFNCPPLSDDEHLGAFKRALRGRLGDAAAGLTDDDYWALGQHHGLATPLLDWTRSPFVALFFAFEDEKVRIGDEYREPLHRAVYAVGFHKIEEAREKNGGALADFRIVSPTGDSNRRLLSQSALFVRMPRESDLEGLIRQSFAGESENTPLTKVVIPNDGRSECLVALSKMNINRMTLFPDADGAAAYVNSLWEPGHEEAAIWV